MGFRFLWETVQVQVLLSAPNKHDGFDTKVSETIVLFLFAKMPAAQGFSSLPLYEFVSVWVFGGVLTRLWTPIFVCVAITLKLFLE